MTSINAMVLADPFADSYQERMQGMQETSIEAYGIILELLGVNLLHFTSWLVQQEVFLKTVTTISKSPDEPGHHRIVRINTG